MANPTDPRRFPFPPLIPVLVLLASWGLGKLWPLPLAYPRWTFWLGLVLFTVPHALALWAHRTFVRHQTTANPTGEVKTVASDGPFAFTRNPMYLALVVLYVGGLLLFRLTWAAILLLPMFLVLQYGVILPEEKYLEARFGATYADYRRRVRRWI